MDWTGVILITIENSRFCAAEFIPDLIRDHLRPIVTTLLAGIYYPEGYNFPFDILNACVL
jgi:hypothetical protein